MAGPDMERSGALMDQHSDAIIDRMPSLLSDLEKFSFRRSIADVEKYYVFGDSFNGREKAFPFQRMHSQGSGITRMEES